MGTCGRWAPGSGTAVVQVRPGSPPPSGWQVWVRDTEEANQLQQKVEWQFGEGRDKGLGEQGEVCQIK